MSSSKRAISLSVFFVGLLIEDTYTTTTRRTHKIIVQLQCNTYILLLPEELVLGALGLVYALAHGELGGVALRVQVGVGLGDELLYALAQALGRLHFGVGALLVVLAEGDPLLRRHAALGYPQRIGLERDGRRLIGELGILRVDGVRRVLVVQVVEQLLARLLQQVDLLVRLLTLLVQLALDRVDHLSLLRSFTHSNEFSFN